MLLMKSKFRSVVQSMTLRPRTSKDAVLLTNKNAKRLMKRSVLLGSRIYAIQSNFKSALPRMSVNALGVTRGNAALVLNSNVLQFMSKNAGQSTSRSVQHLMNSNAPPLPTRGVYHSEREGVLKLI